MNPNHTVLQLCEALEELSRTIEELKSDPDCGEAELEVAMAHIYHHLNTAWNSRNESEERTTACSTADLAQWRQFPKDIDLNCAEA